MVVRLAGVADWPLLLHAHALRQGNIVAREVRMFIFRPFLAIPDVSECGGGKDDGKQNDG